MLSALGPRSMLKSSVVAAKTKLLSRAPPRMNVGFATGRWMFLVVFLHIMESGRSMKNAQSEIDKETIVTIERTELS